MRDFQGIITYAHFAPIKNIRFIKVSSFVRNESLVIHPVRIPPCCLISRASLPIFAFQNGEGSGRGEKTSHTGLFRWVVPPRLSAGCLGGRGTSALCSSRGLRGSPRPPASGSRKQHLPGFIRTVGFGNPTYGSKRQLPSMLRLQPNSNKACGRGIIGNCSGNYR